MSGAFRVGLVKTLDAASGRVRVTFPDRDQMDSWWLPVVFAKTQNDKAYWMPDVGEQVVCLMDEYDEDGAVLGSIYSSVDTPPAADPDKLMWNSRDGASFSYDRVAHALQIALPGGGAINLTANGAAIAIDTSGDITITAGGQVKLAGGGAPIARVGDATSCPAGAGQIVAGSAKVTSG